ncbi:Protein saf4 [Coemansia sp. RSA 1813]|nr:Protein saf4 [Coemansia sp. RSA 1646]KAJ1773631.1 Protein saf4 [Coemansia sp. RSA 1843]KAJ2092353.1 Protein saf4 [Coemansia sp. RSA 986]KAJ2217420.1 Protein saf4 [Coemansia sp. RSA 487]KAJ2572646.1 Protein saf4 [Coemansia sp. RSA 1813]
MAERKAINKYYPPDWDPSKGSVNQFVGQHPLRSRARKLDEGILVVRMALPFSMWCHGCGELLAKGLRFNAEKTKTGNFLNSVPVWNFRLKCRLCSKQWIALRTDPESASYVIVSGARKKLEAEDSDGGGGGAGDDETFGEDIIDMANAPANASSGGKGNRTLRELELAEHRKKRAAQAIDRLASLKRDSDKHWRNADRANSKLRDTFRVGRRQRERNKRESDEIQERMGINVPILPAEATDSIEASVVEYGDNADEATRRKRTRLECAARPLFDTAKRDGKPSLKNRVVRKRLSELDPFASSSIGHFGAPSDLGIKPESPKEPGTNDALARLSLVYGSQSSESSDQHDNG